MQADAQPRGGELASTKDLVGHARSEEMAGVKSQFESDVQCHEEVTTHAHRAPSSA